MGRRHEKVCIPSPTRPLVSTMLLLFKESSLRTARSERDGSEQHALIGEQHPAEMTAHLVPQPVEDDTYPGKQKPARGREKRFV